MQVGNYKTLVPSPRAKRLWILFAIVFVIHVACQWLLWPVKVLGDSMYPAYTNGSRHYVNKLAYISQTPQRGDVVAVRVRPGEIYIKRVIGLPGESLSFEGGLVHINGRKLAEVHARIPWHNDPVILGPDDYCVMGDNRAISVLGAIPRDRIMGKVVF